MTAKAGRGSALERELAVQIMALKLPAPRREYRALSPRRYRLDFAWPDLLLACEVEGGIWTAGRHTRGAGFEADCAKYNALTLAGWRILRVTARQVRSGEAIGWIRAALGVPEKQRATRARRTA